MGLIHIELFATLDLVGQAPGGPEEDPVGFPFGGWQAPLMDEVAGAQVGAAYEGTDALLLGRRTYDIFAAYWPHQEGGEDNEIATLFNSVPKYVASRGRPDLSWAGSTQLGPDLAGAVREIRDRHEHVKVVGSLNLVQTLLREKLFDRLDLWVHPIVLGVGKKVFDGGAVPTNVTLLEPPVAGPKGTVYLRYGLADGTPATGDMSAPDRGVGRDVEPLSARRRSARPARSGGCTAAERRAEHGDDGRRHRRPQERRSSSLIPSVSQAKNRPATRGRLPASFFSTAFHSGVSSMRASAAARGPLLVGRGAARRPPACGRGSPGPPRRPRPTRSGERVHRRGRLGQGRRPWPRARSPSPPAGPASTPSRASIGQT